MKFFLKHLKATWRSGLEFLMGVIIVMVINATLNDDKDYAAIGTMMALMATAIGGLLRGAGAPVRYRTAVSMGHTRRSYILADPAVTALTCLVGIGVAWVLRWVEMGLYSLLYPGWSCEFDLLVVFQWWVILLLVAGVTVADFCMGALQLRFGQKGFLAIWFPLCFAPMIISNATHAATEGNTSLFGQIGRGVLFLIQLLSPVAWAAVGGAVILALVVLSVLCYKRAEVRI